MIQEIDFGYIRSPKRGFVGQCMDKAKFLSFELAQAEIKRSHWKNPNMETYICPWCNSFHNGNGLSSIQPQIKLS